PVVVLHQIHQEIEHLRFDRNRLAAPAQFTPIEVKYLIFKQNLHVSPRKSGRPQETIKSVSRINQAPGKAFWTRRGHPLRSGLFLVRYCLNRSYFMTQIQTISPNFAGNRTTRFIAFLYGLAAYFTFFGTILYAIG